MTAHEEQAIRCVVTSTMRWLNGDMCRNWFRVLLADVERLRRNHHLEPCETCIACEIERDEAIERVHKQSELLSK